MDFTFKNWRSPIESRKSQQKLKYTLKLSQSLNKKDLEKFIYSINIIKFAFKNDC